MTGRLSAVSVGTRGGRINSCDGAGHAAGESPNIS